MNSHVRLLSGECLGELGAIDPGRLDFSTSDNQGKGLLFVVSNPNIQIFNAGMSAILYKKKNAKIYSYA